jgi:hypothetical protein
MRRATGRRPIKEREQKFDQELAEEERCIPTEEQKYSLTTTAASQKL